LNSFSPRISIIIRTKNEGAFLERVLIALLEQDYPDGLEIIIVDSGSTDRTLDIAKRYNTRLIEIKPEEFTFGRALNIGCAAARGEFLVSLSGHAIPVNKEYLKNLTAPYEDPQVMATFGRDVPLPGCCPSQARDIEEWFPNEWLDRGHFFSNANASLRRTAWEWLPFDETLTGAEDALWAKQVLAAGYKIIYVPTAAAYHSHTASPRFIYKRAVRETKALKLFEPARAQVGLKEALRFWWGISLRDFAYAFKHGFHPKWYLHIPIYRAAQAWGLYIGSR